MQNFWTKFKLVITDKSLRNKILFVLGAIIVFRLLAAIPIPGIDATKLASFLNNNQFFGVLNIFSGGGLSRLSIIMLGVGPYITGSIIMQLLTIMVPKLKQLYHEEGEAGRKKFAQYSRIITIPLAAVQAYGLMFLFEKQGIITNLSLFGHITSLVVAIAGSIFLMWIGELISEFGIGNGVSIIIFAGIVASVPTHVSEFLFTFTKSSIPFYLVFLAVSLLVIAGVILISEAERPIPVTYAKQTRGVNIYGGSSTYLPLRVNQAGVIPIIFALSLLLLPQMIGNLLSSANNTILHKISIVLSSFTQDSWVYMICYFLLVFIFTYFYTAVTFDPKALSENLQKNGAFVPGIRPGEATAEYVSKVTSRITLVGALFLGLIAVMPLLMRALTGITAIALGGTSLLIVVSVVLDLVKKMEAQIGMREY